MKHHRKLAAAAALVAAALLSGCWDDDKNEDPVTPTVVAEVPDSAGISTASFVSYILGLNSSDESSEPLIIKDTFAVPADEASEPTAL